MASFKFWVPATTAVLFVVALVKAPRTNSLFTFFESRPTPNDLFFVRTIIAYSDLSQITDLKCAEKRELDFYIRIHKLAWTSFVYSRTSLHVSQWRGHGLPGLVAEAGEAREVDGVAMIVVEVEPVVGILYLITIGDLDIERRERGGKSSHYWMLLILARQRKKSFSLALPLCIENTLSLILLWPNLRCRNKKPWI